jgi:hypothetical protein
VTGIVQIALVYSAVIAVGITPLAAQSPRAGLTNILIYGAVLLLVLAVYVMEVLPSMSHSMIGLLLTGVGELVLIDVSPPAR